MRSARSDAVRDPPASGETFEEAREAGEAPDGESQRTPAAT